MIRIGHGFDVHGFAEGRRLVIGGVDIPHDRGLAGHSDADVLLHAICDALLGAAAKGDIGHLFPDDDETWRGADSRLLLGEVVQRLHTDGYTVSNIDCTIVAQLPRMAPHIDSMRENIATDCRVATEQVNIKATTTERLGYTGRGEGIAAHAVVLIEK
ncbi:MAG: 2-C-methyl-D-erythritol 2,4-cyclodiphosphate synthase [marine bacterium B5-7]|nr:MAG: 2-C-methyl-D-erythritol 2,4-cyclodiphosphate synthase [marine bacterium B5-7]